MADKKKRAIRPNTENLVNSVMLDVWPAVPTATDFGIDSQKHYEALYYPIRAGEITPEQLEKALGNGPKLTQLTKAAPSNPHKDIQFQTAWDRMLPEMPDAPTPPAVATDQEKSEARLQRLWQEVETLTAQKTPPPFCPVTDKRHGKPIEWDDQTEAAKLYLLLTKINWWEATTAEKHFVIDNTIDLDDISSMTKGLMVMQAEWDAREGLAATRPLEKPAAAEKQAAATYAADFRPKQGEKDKTKGREPGE